MFLIQFYVCVLPAYMSVYRILPGANDSPRTAVADGCKLSRRLLRRKEQVLLSTEPSSLQAFNFSFGYLLLMHRYKVWIFFVCNFISFNFIEFILSFSQMMVAHS